MVDRRAEDGHDGVAQELVERSLVAEGGLDHELVEVVQQVDDLLRLQVFGQPREAAEVAEEDGHLAPLSGQYQSLRIPQELLHDLTGHVPGERVLDHLLLAEALGHLVEGVGEHADLVPRGDRQRDLEVPGRNRARPFDETENRASEERRQAQGATDAEQDHRHADRDRPVALPRHRLIDRLLTEAEVEGAHPDPAEDQRHREIDEPLQIGVGVRLNHERVAEGRQGGRPHERLPAQAHVGVGEDLAAVVRDDHVGHARLLHRVLHEQVQGQAVVREQRVFRARAQLLGQRETPLDDLGGHVLLGLPEQEDAQQDHRERQQGGDDQAQLELQGGSQSGVAHRSAWLTSRRRAGTRALAGQARIRACI